MSSIGLTRNCIGPLAFLSSVLRVQCVVVYRGIQSACVGVTIFPA